MSRVTMKDVARYAGVSVATVSNVVNNITEKTTEETRNKVMLAVKALNYNMDMTARSLSKGKSNLIGIFLPEVFEVSGANSILRDNPFYSELISGIEYSARSLGYDVLLATVKSANHAIEIVNKRMLDGIVILGGYVEEFWEKIYSLDIPVVTMDDYNHGKQGFINVGINDELGAYLAAKHLISLGHRRIALATSGFEISEVNRRRYLGFIKAIREEGIDEELCPVIYDEVSFRGGINVGYKIVTDYKDITAIFAVADIMAYGAIKSLRQLGKSVPKDLSVVGFDDLSLCNYTFPGLTTIRQDIYAKGIEVSKLLVDVLSGSKRDIRYSIVPISLVVRETTRSIR